CFFFSSRRRHTRSDRDWSSDVCSSDLRGEGGRFADEPKKGTSNMKKTSFLQPVAAGLLTGLLCFLPASEPQAQIIIFGGGFGGKIGRASCRERVSRYDVTCSVTYN